MFFKEQTHYEHWVDLDFGLASCVALRVAMLTDSHGHEEASEKNDFVGSLSFLTLL